MPRHCVVPFCSEQGGHNFPQDEALLEKWLIAIRRKHFKTTRSTCVCKKHFKPEDFHVPKHPNVELHRNRLKIGAVPSQFAWTKDAEQEKKEIERAERFLQIQKKRETAKLLLNTDKNKDEERNKRKQKFLKKLGDNNDDASNMDFDLMNDDDMIVIVIGDDEEKKSGKKRKTEKPVKDMPVPVTVKAKPLEEDAVVSLNVEKIIKTVAEHGQVVEIKAEPDYYDDYERLDDDFDQQDDVEQADDYEQLDDDYIPGKEKSTKKSKKSQEKVPTKTPTKAPTKSKKSPQKAPTKTPTKATKSNKSPQQVAKASTTENKHTKKKQHGSRKPPVSYVEELRNKFPEFKKDKNGLISYLSNLMRTTVPPQPPQDYYVIDVDGKFICSYCEYKTESINAAGRHFQHTHGPRYLVCYSCGADFCIKKNLYKHEMRCTEPDATLVLRARGQYLGRKGRGRPYMSDNKFVPRMNPLDPTTGEERPPKPEKFQCKFCTAEFVHIEAWESHENIHQGLRPYQCDVCPCAYPSKVGLRKHRMTHGNQQFTCDHCNKSFKMKVILISHMNTHLPQRKYGCSMCPKRYAQKTELRLHINRDHYNLAPACACPQCPKRYTRMSRLKDHMLKKHKLKLLTRKMLFKNLPKNLQELTAAQVVFNQPEPIFSEHVPEPDRAESADEQFADEQFAEVHYLEVPDDEDSEPKVKQPRKVITKKTPIFHIRLLTS